MFMFPGFLFRETMSGSYHLLDSPTEERAIEFTIAVRARDLRKFAKDKEWRIEGDIEVEGLARKRPLEGTLGFKLFDERRLPYRFTFTADDGKTYELRGQKDWSPLSPLESMTVLPASLYDAAGQEIARARLRFDVRNDLRPWLRSFRLTFARA
jgi:hypothetical protein